MKKSKRIDTTQDQVRRSALGICTQAVPYEIAVADSPVHAGKLHFDVGLSKTRSFLAALALEQKQGLARSPVLVVPNTVISRWRRDIESENDPAICGTSEEKLPRTAHEEVQLGRAFYQSLAVPGGDRMDGDTQKPPGKTVLRRPARNVT